MTQAPSKFAKLKRALMGGLLSAGFAGMNLLVRWFAHDTDSLLPFAWPYFYSGLFGFPSGTRGSSLVAIMIWFFLGAGLAYFVRSNKKAVQLWFLPFSLAFLFTVVIWVIIQRFTGI